MSYKDFVEEKRAFYKTIKRCYCPALKQHVVFNSRGFYHLGLLDCTVPAIEKAKDIFEHRVVASARKSGEINEYWALRETVRTITVTVILKKTGSGNVIFYSIW
jgi:hypothetical protein